MKAAIPVNETERLDALRRYEILDTAPQEEFDEIVVLASRICGTPFASVSLVDETRQWFKSKVGLTVNETPRETAFCAHGILQADTFVVEDASNDRRFARNPFVAGESQIRFYAGAPLITPDGHALGMLCVKDVVPRRLKPEQEAALRMLARQVVAQLELRRYRNEAKQVTVERDHAEEELHETRALYHSFVEQMPAGIFRKDAAGRYVLVNTWFCQLRGKGMNEILGRTAAELAAEETDLQVISILSKGEDHHEQVMRTGKSIEVEEQYPQPNGEVRHLQIIKSPVFSADGTVTGSQGILMDITQHKRAQAELNRERDLLRALMDKSEELIYFKDLDSRFVRCSEAMARNFNVKNARELLGKRDSDFFHDEHASAALADEQRIIRTGEPIIGKMEKEIWPDGHITWALSSKMPYRNVDGEIIGTFGISKNITAIKDAEAQLSQVHKQLLDTSRQAGMAEVATSVLHNVGNVLNSVNVSSSLIADKVRSSKMTNIAKVAALVRSNENDLAGFFTAHPKGQQLPAYLEDLAAHLAKEQENILQEIHSLVTNVVHIKEIVAMQQNFAKSSGLLESIAVTELMEDALRMNLASMNRHNVKVTREFAAVPLIITEKHKVLQILVNMIRNAKHACDDAGRADKQITVGIRHEGGSLKISVSDNGVGIPAENLTRIFNHGFTTRKNGHGFGLHSGALSAKQLGGSLTVHSAGSGQGATFILELPVNSTRSDSTQ